MIQLEKSVSHGLCPHIAKSVRDRIQKDLAAIGSQTRENSRIRRGGGFVPKNAILNAKRLIFSPKMLRRKFDDILNPEQLRFPGSAFRF